MEGKVLIDNLETSVDSMYVDVKHNGQPFTGIAYEYCDRFNSEYSYVNGLGHGRGFSVSTNGQLLEEFYLDKGEMIELSRWNEAGVMREYFRWNPLLRQLWDEAGLLLMEEDEATKKEWYKSSKLKSLLIKKKEFVYNSENGEWVVKIKTQHDYVVLAKGEMLFNEPYISDNYMALLQDHDFYKYFILWLSDIENSAKAKVICSMINSTTLWHKYDGINLACQYKIKEAVPIIKLESNNNERPPTIRDIDGIPVIGFMCTIAERAKIALLELRSLKRFPFFR